MNFLSKFAGAIPGTSQILGIAVGLLVLALGVQTWHVHSLQAQVAEQKALVSQKDAALTVCSNDLTLTGKQLAEQSRAVQALQADAAAQAQTDVAALHAQIDHLADVVEPEVIANRRYLHQQMQAHGEDADFAPKLWTDWDVI